MSDCMLFMSGMVKSLPFRRKRTQNAVTTARGDCARIGDGEHSAFASEVGAAHWER